MKYRYFKFTSLQLISWIVIFILPYLNIIFEPERINTVHWAFLLTPFLPIFFLFLVFYVNIFFVAPSFIHNRPVIYFVFAAAGLGLFLFYNAAILNYLSEITRSTAPKTQFDRRWEIFPRIIFPGILYILTVLVSNISFLLDERRIEKEEKQIMNIEKIATELVMLKNQISPHFLFNTLNNIRWMVRKNMENTEEVVLKLSEILRYILYEVGEVKVPISQEIEHLKNYIQLQSLRLPVPGVIEFNVPESVGAQKIEPLLFIHFVENAFKYGIDAKNPPEIVFDLSIAGNQLTFNARNTILSPDNKLESSGIGLSNIKRRLELLYANKHVLETGVKDGYYLVKLIITLDEN
jgi:two-component system LytT family sensor kinase